MKITEKAMYLVAIVLLITVGVFGWMLKQRERTIVETRNIITALTDTVEVGRNNLGQQTAKITNLETAKVKDLLTINSQDKTIKWLQQVVKNNQNRLAKGGSVTVFDSQTTVKNNSPTTVVPKDTTLVTSVNPKSPDTIKLYPEYRSIIALGKWINGDVRANKDSTVTSLKVYNEYEVVNGEEPIAKSGFLGINRKFRSYSEVTNLNPYSETSVIRTYNVKEQRKVKRIGIGPQVGYTPFNGSNKYFIGVGISYNVINLF